MKDSAKLIYYVKTFKCIVKKATAYVITVVLIGTVCNSITRLLPLPVPLKYKYKNEDTPMILCPEDIHTLTSMNIVLVFWY